jgi:hypothetical protein
VTRDNALDPVQALDAAVDLFREGRFQQLAEVLGDVMAAKRVTEVADVFVAWYRRPASVTLTLVSIRDQDTGEMLPIPPGGTVTTIDTNDIATYVIDAADARGFAVDASLAVTVTPEGAVTAVINEATTGTASGKDELVVTAVAPGSALVKVFDPAQEDTVFGSDSVDVTPGAVATVVLGTPVITQQP